MTNGEAINILKFHRGYFCDLKGCQEQQAFTMAIRALEKQIPQTSTIENGFVKCPKCKKYIRFPIADKYNNCPECGQAIKWEESEETE